MEPELQRRIQRYGWDRAATYYEQFWKQQLAPAQERMLALTELQPGERVLDIACGTGLVTFAAAEMVGPSGSVLATDISDRMLDTVREMATMKQANVVSTARMDAEDLRVADQDYDAVLCALGLMYVPDVLLSLREMFRALKPGGRAVATVWGQRDRCGWAGIFPVVDARVHTEVCPLFFQLGTQDILKQVFEQVGFKNVVLERLSTTLHYDSPESACGAAFIGGPVALAYSRFDERTRSEAFAEYLETIEPYRDGNEYNIPGEFVVVKGFRPKSNSMAKSKMNRYFPYADGCC